MAEACADSQPVRGFRFSALKACGLELGIAVCLVHSATGSPGATTSPTAPRVGPAEGHYLFGKQWQLKRQKDWPIP